MPWHTGEGRPHLTYLEVEQYVEQLNNPDEQEAALDHEE